MAGPTTVLLSIKFIFCIMSTVYGLSCISCISDDLHGKCRLGGKLKKVQTCYGRNATCYSTITVIQNGSTTITRGCSKRIFCSESDAVVDYCITCNFKHCNLQPMELNINRSTITGKGNKIPNEYRNTETTVIQTGVSNEVQQNKYTIENRYNEDQRDQGKVEETKMTV